MCVPTLKIQDPKMSSVQEGGSIDAPHLEANEVSSSITFHTKVNIDTKRERRNQYLMSVVGTVGTVGMFVSYYHYHYHLYHYHLYHYQYE